MNCRTFVEVPSTPRGQRAIASTVNTTYWKPNSANRCKHCGRRIRSENHEQGSHHNTKK